MGIAPIKKHSLKTAGSSIERTRTASEQCPVTDKPT
jgi:hypothetical protein